MNLIDDAVISLKRKIRRWDFFAPQQDVDPAMMAASKGINRFIMFRSKLIEEVADLALPHTDHIQDPHSARKMIVGKLRNYGTTYIFWAKQTLVIAAERDANEGTSLSGEAAMRTITTIGHSFADLAANIRHVPDMTPCRWVTSLCNQLFPAGYMGSRVIPYLTEQLEVIEESTRRGYNLGSEGILAPIIKRHHADHLDVLQFCIDRGIENFSAENYHEYQSVGVMREGML